MKKLAAAAFLMASVSMPALGATFTPDNQSIVVDASGVAHTNSPPRLATSSSTIAASDMAGFVAFSGTNLTATIPSMPAGSTVEICNYDATALTLSPAQSIKGYASATLPGLNNGLASCLNLVSLGGQWWATVAIPGAVTTTPPVTPPPTSDTLVLRMSEDRWQTDAQFNVYMDGAKINTAALVTTAIHGQGSQAFTFTGTWGSGAHTLGIEFLNDMYGGSPLQDLNLYLDGATYDGVAASGGVALYNGGVQTLVLP